MSKNEIVKGFGKWDYPVKTKEEKSCGNCKVPKEECSPGCNGYCDNWEPQDE